MSYMEIQRRNEMVYGVGRQKEKHVTSDDLHLISKDREVSFNYKIDTNFVFSQIFFI